jgi:putative (di)nucleoside polyphosphate hydrolase
MSEAAPDRAPATGYRRAVGIMLLNPAGEVLVAQRLDFPGDAWQMPQGGIDKGETPLQAARRELKEEIGTDKAEVIAESRRWLAYDFSAELRRRVWRGRYRGQTQKWFAMRFTGSDADIDLETEHPEFSAWKWVPPSELTRLIVPFKRQLYQDVIEEFRGLLKLS